MAGLAQQVLRLRKAFGAFCEPELQRLGLTSGLLYFFLYIDRHPGCAPGALAAALRADAGQTARSVERLVQLGYVRREKDPADGRARCLWLTAAGAAAFRQVTGLFGAWDEAVCAGLSAAEQEQLTAALDTVWRSARAGLPRQALGKGEAK